MQREANGKCIVPPSVCVCVSPFLAAFEAQMLSSGTSPACLGHFTGVKLLPLQVMISNVSFPFFLVAQRNPAAACGGFVSVLGEALSKRDISLFHRSPLGLEKKPKKKLQISSLLCCLQA